MHAITRLAIIADDLTGASDSGVQLARKGLRTQVRLEEPGGEAAPAALDAVVVDTDSRALPREQAYARVREAAEALRQQGYTWIYKKLDSTLRGNVGAEIDAVLDAFGFAAAAIAPAYPKIGRTTSGGIHYVHGVPVHETEIGRDPKTPVPESGLRERLARQSARPAIRVELAALRGGDAVRRLIDETLERERSPLFLFDAETEEDLQRIAALVSVYGSRFLWCGSAGLAEWLPLRERSAVGGGAAGGPGGEEADRLPHGRPVMLVAGSLSRVTREQVAAASAAPGVAAVELNAAEAVAGGDRRKRELDRCAAALDRALQRGSDASLSAGTAPEQVRAAQEEGARHGIDPSDAAARIADALGAVVREVLSRHRLGGLVLTGGDTAKAVCRHLGVHGIELEGELEPGIPVGSLIGGELRFGGGRLRAVTKAGAFGRPESLLRAMNYLKGEGRID